MTEDRAANGRIGYMDGLRAAAMVGVILIHVCAKAAADLAAAVRRWAFPGSWPTCWTRWAGLRCRRI